MLVINDTWATRTITRTHLEDGVIIMIPISLEIVATFTSMAWEGRTRSLGAIRALFIGLASVMVVTPTTFLKTIIATWKNFSEVVW